MQNLFIIHPFVQSYRRGLYERLFMGLQERGLQLQVIENTPPPKLRDRQDSISARWSHPVESKWIHVFGKDIAYRSLGTLEAKSGDLFIVEQALKNVETYQLLKQRHRTGFRVAMWGHGRTYSTKQAPILTLMKAQLTRQVDWFFSYTSSGADYVASKGFPPERITVLNNTIDTDELQSEIRSLSSPEITAAQRRWGLSVGNTALFLGGIDEQKGIRFLLESARLIQRERPQFRLLVAGQGSMANDVISAAQSGYPVVYLGRVEGRLKATALAVTDVLMIPQWIGLVAVDALVAGKPILSTLHPSHSPEHEYLLPERHVIYSPVSTAHYARSVCDLLRDPERLSDMQSACAKEASLYSISEMSQRYINGISQWCELRTF